MTDLSKVILGTGNYENVKSGNTVSITGDGGNAWGYYGPSYKKLAPKLITYLPYAQKYAELVKLKNDSFNIYEYLEFKNKIEDDYIKSYYEIRLKNLNVYELLNTLYEKYGDNIILLCHERVNEFCHRRLVANYIEITTNLCIPEISVDNYGKVKKLVSISYKDKIKKLIDK